MVGSTDRVTVSPVRTNEMAPYLPHHRVVMVVSDAQPFRPDRPHATWQTVRHGTDHLARKPHQHRRRTARRRIAGTRLQPDRTDLGEVSSEQFRGKSVLLNIFPSVDTPVCATSVRTFNERAAASGVAVVCVSKDLPFAQKRFCGAEGIENVTTASAFRDDFGQDYGVALADGPMAGLLARAVVVIGADGNVTYTNWSPKSARSPTTTQRWRPLVRPDSSNGRWICRRLCLCRVPRLGSFPRRARSV